MIVAVHDPLRPKWKICCSSREIATRDVHRLAAIITALIDTLDKQNKLR